MYFDGHAEIVGVKSPEPGIIEVEFESLADGSLSGEQLVDVAHVVAEVYTGQGESQSPMFKFAVQFAVRPGDGDLLLKLVLRQAINGDLKVQEHQLELPLGDTRKGAAALRWLCEGIYNGSIKVTGG